MKKTSLIVLIFSTLFTICQAQEKYLTISGGYTNPLGDFSKSDVNNKESGFAKDGYNFSFEMSFYFNNFFGIGANLRFANCNFDSDLFNDLLKDRFQGQLDTINLESGNYNLQNFLFGPYVKADIGSNFALYGKVFIGVMSTYRPNQTLVYQEAFGDLQTIETVGKYTGSFAYNFGVGALVKFNDRLGLNFSADYIAGNPKFDDFDYLALKIVKKKQSIAYLNYNAGLLLTF